MNKIIKEVIVVVVPIIVEVLVKNKKLR